MGGLAVAWFICGAVLNSPVLFLMAGVMLQLHCVIFTYMFYFALLVTFPQTMLVKGTKADVKTNHVPVKAGNTAVSASPTASAEPTVMIY